MNKLTNQSYWYSYADIDTLLSYYLRNHDDVEVLTALLATNTEAGNELEDTLKEFKKQHYKSKTLIPINLNQGHWALIYISNNTAYYFDPLGNAIYSDTEKAIRAAFQDIEIVNLDSRLQSDGSSCGVHVVEAARSLLVNGGLSSSIDTQAAREEHSKKLTLMRYKQEAKASRKGLQIVGIFGGAHEKYINDYLARMDELINSGVETDNLDLLLAIKMQNEEIHEFLKETRQKKR